MSHFIPITPEEKKEMLKKIGVKNFEELINTIIPEEIRLKGELDLPESLSELEVKREVEKIANLNVSTDSFINFMGAGAYDHFIPSAVFHIISRPEFYTAYTPYQAEASQGTLQALYEYQSMICELMEMDIANSSMYDGGTAIAEACRMALAIKKGEKVLVAGTLHPYYLRCIKTYLSEEKVLICPEKGGQIDIEKLDELMKDACAFVCQSPNFYGVLEEVFDISEIVHKNGGLLIAVPLPISLGLLSPPGEYDADIVACEGQTLGLPLNFGGPYLGILCARREFIRYMPGRIIGRTVDKDGKDAFCMVLQTREQHIRRARATSNICTNQTLCAIASAVYLALMGKEGLREVAELCMQKAHYLAEKIEEIEGFNLKYKKPFFNEFVVETPLPALEICEKLKDKKIFAGVPLSKFYPEREKELLIAVTEKRTKCELDNFVELLNTFKVA